MINFKRQKKEKKRATTKKLATGFTVMIIPDSSDSTRITEITYDRLVKMIFGAIAVAIIMVGLIVSMMMHNYRLKQTLTGYEEAIEQQNQTNETLAKTIENLYERIEEDQKAFEKIQKTIDEQTEAANEAAREAAIPSGIPVKGASFVTVDDPFADGEGKTGGLVLSAGAGAIVVATGSGVIENISKDEYYGMKIVINHNNGYRTIFRLQEKPSCAKGQKIKRNDMLTTFTADGLIAYEITKDGVNVNPRDIMIVE